jgi:hypothetical protein
MGFRFLNKIKLFPGVSLNVSRSGVSVSAGPRGAKVTVGSKGVRKTIGIPGTGLSYTEYTKYNSSPEESYNHGHEQVENSNDKTVGCGVLLLVGLAVLISYLVLK